MDARRDAADPRLENGAGRTIPITGRLAGTLDAYLTAAHPTAGERDYVFYSTAPDRQINQATVYTRFRGYLADASIPISPAARIRIRCATGSRSRTRDAGLRPARTSP